MALVLALARAAILGVARPLLTGCAVCRRHCQGSGKGVTRLLLGSYVWNSGVGSMHQELYSFYRETIASLLTCSSVAEDAVGWLEAGAAAAGSGAATAGAAAAGALAGAVAAAAAAAACDSPSGLLRSVWASSTRLMSLSSRSAAAAFSHSWFASCGAGMAPVTSLAQFA